MDVSAPPPRDLAQEGRDTLQTSVDLAPQVFAAKAKFDPQYVDLQTSNVRRSLLGNGVDPGLIDLFEQIAPRLQASSDAATTAQRTRDIADVGNLGGEAFKAFAAANPRLSALRDKLSSDAMAGLDAGTGLTPEEMRTTQQNARAASSARGFGMGPSDAFSELLAMNDRGFQRKQQRQAFATQVAGLEAASSVDPFMAILGRPSQAAAFGQNMLGAGSSNVGSAGSQNFNPFANPYAQDLYNTNYNAQAAANIAEANANAALYGAAISAAGNIGSSAFKCWVAREVFGDETCPTTGGLLWLQFRRWLDTRAPRWFHDLYVAHGEAFAQWLHEHPEHKPGIREWMLSRIFELNPARYMDREGRWWTLRNLVQSFLPHFYQGKRDEDGATVVIHRSDFQRKQKG